MANMLLSMTMVNRLALVVARDVPRYDEDGLFYVKFVVDAPNDALTMSCNSFIDRIIAPAYLRALNGAWEDPRDALPGFRSGDWAVESLDGVTSRAIGCYDYPAGQYRIQFEMQIG